MNVPYQIQKLPLLTDIQRVALIWARNGSWISSSDPPLYEPPKAITLPFGEGHQFREGCGSDLDRQDVLKPRWQPSLGTNIPPFPRWSLLKTCEAIEGRTIIVVGDSMSGEFTDSLISALTVWTKDLSSKMPLNRGDVSMVCGIDIPTNVIWIPVTVFEDGAPWRELLWDAHSKSINSSASPPIFILNRGAWPLPRDLHIARVSAALAFVRSLAPDSLIFWRTTNTGHPNCAKYKSALSFPIPLTDYSGLAIQYKWHQIPAINAYTLLHLPSDVIVLEIEPATLLRADSHPLRKFAIDGVSQDSLHYCIPGPIDMWVELFAVIRFSRGLLD